MAITRKNKNNNNKSLMGGKVIGSGGFGCIFKPALKCKKKPRVKNNITKLMKSKHVYSEYNEVIKYNNLLKKIPNYSDYFLVEGFSICKPEPLTKKDLHNFNNKCNALKKLKINEENINDKNSLRKILALNMPYGGTDVSKLIDENWDNSIKMKELNNSLIKLLEKGIVPMNQLHIFHCDLKASNILAREGLARLIDWGLSTSYSNKEEPVPRVLTNRPFQYNIPFSNIIFTPLFEKMYKKFLDKNPNPDYFTMRTFVINYIIEWVKERGPGHLKTMNNIFKNLFGNELKIKEENLKGELIQYDYTFYFIFEYITKILMKFTKDGKFDIKTYFVQVFLKNIDVWGFIMCYMPIIENITNNSKHLSGSEMALSNKIKDLVVVLIDADDHVINVTDLIEKLKELNTYFVTFKRNKHITSETSDSDMTTSETTTTTTNTTTPTTDLETPKKSVSSGTRRIRKQKHFHKMIVKTLKNIKSLHSKKAWM